MSRLAAWLRDSFAHRPWWMNALMVLCAFIAYVYVPWDFLFKPVARDQEAWFGLLLHGRAAKMTEPLHFLIYATGAFGFWRMKSWMWPWAAVYAAVVAFGMFTWPITYKGGAGGWILGIASAAPFVWIAYALWDSKHLFGKTQLALRERYGDWALVTGASAGIGEEFARALAAEGISCVLTARRKERLAELATELETRWNVQTRVVAADLSTPGGADLLVDAVSDIDLAILVNNAGVGYAGRFDKQDPDRLRAMVELNCTSPVVLTSRLLPKMIERTRGAIIVVGSTAGRQALPFLGVYAATKAFDLLFGEALFVELRDRGIDVTVLMPGPVATEFERSAGETRVDPSADELPENCVRIALEALGRQPAVVSGTWMNFVRANVNRVLPRAVMAFVAGDFTERQTPANMR